MATGKAMFYPPLIITLQLQAADQLYFNELRNRYFPAHANYLDAHITLFHKLPSNEPLIPQVLQQVAQRTAIALQVSGVSNMGTGVAYALVSAETQALHQQLQQAFEPWLVRQDRQRIWPHITIQNKVTAFKAQQLHTTLQETFQPFMIQATGIATWKYLKGPWRPSNFYPFTG
ncbi:2'-5' RNA ligase family protein [Deminuibacter soli]|uniref:2'-5' RNA ligase family protein n=1 Tax=Deminuibacter soli TaxID=2291815 RepID=A0A3E1NC82_9BACT|nr:2'-5' RNA ligase family protein [Deminuibacter soli]RFM25629.1 2'-5' RNA ligase family protein [Deminuibacter soli]